MNTTLLTRYNICELYFFTKLLFEVLEISLKKYQGTYYNNTNFLKFLRIQIFIVYKNKLLVKY